MNSSQPPLSASSIAKMKLMAADRELSQALVKVVYLFYLFVTAVPAKLVESRNQCDSESPCSNSDG